jgi:hypothetical protein
MLSRMGEKVVEDKVPATAGNLERSRDREPAGLGAGVHKAPARERTILGVAVPQQTEAPVAPVGGPPPLLRETTVLGVGIKGMAAVARPLAGETSVQEPPPEGWDLPERTLELEAPPADAKPAARLERVEPQRIPPPARDASLPIDLSVRKARSEPAGVPRRRRSMGWVALVLVAAAAAAGYLRREQLRPGVVATWHQLRDRVTTPR